MKKRSATKIETLGQAEAAMIEGLKVATRQQEVLGFVRESNRIEGINRDPTPEEIEEFYRFMALPYIAIVDLVRFVSIYQPGAKLREKPGMDVYIGMHQPMRGGPDVSLRLQAILDQAERGPQIVHKDCPDNAYTTHIAYEHLHPFMDGNGRSGRMLWAWQLQMFPLGFLHHFYYQTLAHQKDQI